MKKHVFILLIFCGFSSQTYAGFASDLDIFLVHDGISIQLFAGAEDDSDGPLDTIFDDESLNSPVGTFPYPPNMQSVESLSAFDGKNLNGVWELHILDDYFSGDGDALVSWSIFGTLDSSTAFNYDGPSAFNVDTFEPTIVSFSVSGSGLIGDINVAVSVSPALVPPAVWLFGSGLIGFIVIRKKSANLSDN